MAFSYSTGDPTKIADPNTASMADIKNSFADVKTFLNGGNLTAASISPSVYSPYFTIAKASTRILTDTDLVTTGYVALNTKGYLWQVGVAPFDASAPQIIPFDPAHYALTGKTLKTRLSLSVGFSDATNQSVTFSICSIGTLTNGVNGVTLNGLSVVGASQITVSSSFVGPGTFSTSDFTAPSAGNYVYCVAPVAGTPHTGVASVTYYLQGRYV